ncbi:hypothetical protein, partial [Marinospirillum sp.]|uniref:hypothetical protein n=1 Tax=Marinospirillum sp. TaxID=2183934 RepID=UPI0025BA7FB7
TGGAVFWTEHPDGLTDFCHFQQSTILNRLIAADKPRLFCTRQQIWRLMAESYKVILYWIDTNASAQNP